MLLRILITAVPESLSVHRFSAEMNPLSAYAAERFPSGGGRRSHLQGSVGGYPPTPTPSSRNIPVYCELYAERFPTSGGRRPHLQGAVGGYPPPAGAPPVAASKISAGPSLIPFVYSRPSSSPRSKEFVCKFWKAGNCKKGNQCSLLHSWTSLPGLVMLTTLDGHKKDLKGIALPQGSDKLFSASSDGTLRVWDCHTGKCDRIINLHEEAGSLITEGQWVFLGLLNALKAFNVQTSTCSLLCEVVGLVSAITIGNGMLFAGTSSGSISVWKTTDNESYPFTYLTSLEGHHSGGVTCFIVGRGLLFSGSIDKTIKVWDISTLECTRTLRQHTNTVTSLLCWDQYLISSSLDGTIKVWSRSENGSLKVTLTRRQQHSVHTLFGMGDAEARPIIFCSYEHGTVSVCDLPSFEERGRLFSEATVSAMTVAPQGLFFTGDKSGKLTVWNFA